MFDDAFTFGDKSSKEESHTGTDIWTGNGNSVERSGALDDDAMRVSESDVGTHERETISKEHTGFIHPVVTKSDTFGLGSENDEGTHGISGEAGPGTSLETLSE